VEKTVNATAKVTMLAKAKITTNPRPVG